MPSPRLLTACFLSFVGAAILVEFVTFGGPHGIGYDRSAVGLGDLLTFIGSFFFAVAIFQIDLFHKRGVRGALTFGMFSVSILLSTAGALLMAGADGLTSYTNAAGSLDSALVFLAIVVPSTTLAFHWMNKYQGFFSPTHAAVIYMLEPLSAALWSLFLPGWLSGVIGIHYPSEHPTLPVLIGGVIILVANLLPSLEE